MCMCVWGYLAWPLSTGLPALNPYLTWPTVQLIFDLAQAAQEVHTAQRTVGGRVPRRGLLEPDARHETPKTLQP